MEYYTSKVLSRGELASEFIDEGVMVFFGEQAPEELQEYSIVHEHHTLPTEDLQAGDVLTINGEEIEILAVGRVANENFRNLGHLVIKFNGNTDTEMDGDINVPSGNIPDPKLNSMLMITRKE